MYATSGGNGMAISMTMMQARNDRRGKRAELPDDIARKLKSCSVLNCEDWRDLGSYTTYHCFPTGEKNQDRWELWTQLLRKAREDDSWIPFRGSLVCSHHFRPEDFINEPLSKRRKLVKDAIPSIFPTFTVDLDDPSYQLPETEGGSGGDDNADQEQEEYIYTDTDPITLLDLTGEEGYEYEYATEGDDVDFQDGSFGQGQVQLQESEDEDIQVISDINVKKLSPSTIKSSATQGFVRNRASSSNGTNPTTVTSVGQVKLLSTSSVSMQQQKQGKMPLLQIPPNKVIHLSNNKVPVQTYSNTSSNPRNQQRVTTTSSQSVNLRPIQPKKLKREQEAVKALSSLPFSLNPDLEIEMVDPEEEMVAYRNRISELEQQNRNITTRYENTLGALKQKYESQLGRLRQRLIEQERLLNLHQISSSNVSSAKKVRLS